MTENSVNSRTNWPFPSFPKPLFQSEAKLEAIDMKMIFLFPCKHNSLSQERFRNYARFESEGFCMEPEHYLCADWCDQGLTAWYHS